MSEYKHLVPDIIKYIETRNRRYPQSKATVRHISKRFRLSQKDVEKLICESSQLYLSVFAYKDAPPNVTWAQMMLSAWFPQEWPDAPLGRRLVDVIDDNEEID